MLRSDRIGKRAQKSNYTLVKTEYDTRFKEHKWFLIRNLVLSDEQYDDVGWWHSSCAIKSFKNLAEVEEYLRNCKIY